MERASKIVEENRVLAAAAATTGVLALANIPT